MSVLGNRLMREGLRQLEARLPPGWHVVNVRAASVGDALAEIRAPDTRAGVISIEAKASLTPKIAMALVDRLKSNGVIAPLVITDFVSRGTSDVLRTENVSYLDLTGNMRMVLSEPGLFIETVGAAENPNPTERTETLKGLKAGRVVRALLEEREPTGVRDLAGRVGVDAGYVSRLYRFLGDEVLIRRVGRGRIERVDWLKLLQRWANDVPFSARGRIATFIEPRGLSAFLEKLHGVNQRYAITGSFAASRFAPLAPAKLATLYVDDAGAFADDLKLRPADVGANIQLVEPSDDAVFDGEERHGLRYTSIVQVAADLLTSPGRAPAEGAELLEWMKANEEVWRG